MGKIRVKKRAKTLEMLRSCKKSPDCYYEGLKLFRPLGLYLVSLCEEKSF